MDEHLPVLKDFEPESEPPEAPEPWWKRYYAYIFFTVALPVVCAGMAYGADVYGYSKHWILRNRSPDEIWDVMKWDMTMAAVIGLGTAVILSVAWEVREIQARRNKRATD